MSHFEVKALLVKEKEARLGYFQVVPGVAFWNKKSKVRNKDMQHGKYQEWGSCTFTRQLILSEMSCFYH